IEPPPPGRVRPPRPAPGSAAPGPRAFSFSGRYAPCHRRVPDRLHHCKSQGKSKGQSKSRNGSGAIPNPGMEYLRPAVQPFRRFFANLGPGLITGAADDDPSGITTYSVAGAAYGYLPLWTALLSFPLMSAL